MLQEATSDAIQWVPKARWVVDGNIWTSSGVTAGVQSLLAFVRYLKLDSLISGMDMANAFLTHVYGEKTTKQIRNIIEFTAKQEGDDEFAQEYGLA